MRTRTETRTTRSAPRRGALTLVTLASVGAVLLLLSVASAALVGEGGTLNVPSWVLGAGTLVLSGAGLAGLARMYGSVRRASTCGRGGC